MAIKRALSIRLPMDLYLTLAEEAQAEGVDMNQKANEYIRLGIGEKQSLDQALRNMFNRYFEGEMIENASS